jgi:hypothetical protein
MRASAKKKRERRLGLSVARSLRLRALIAQRLSSDVEVRLGVLVSPREGGCPGCPLRHIGGCTFCPRVEPGS